MQTKLAQLKAAARAGNWQGAIRIAAKFPQLAEHRVAITRAHGCYNDPGFYAQLGHDTDACIAAGIAALKARYNLTEGEQTMNVKTYSSKSNAAKAARSALGKADAKHGTDFVCYEKDGRWGFELPETDEKGHEPKRAVRKVSTPGAPVATKQVQTISVKAQRAVEAAAKASGPRPGSKTEITFELMKRPEGCTMKESAEAGGLNESLNDVVARFATQYGYTAEKVKDGRTIRYCLRATQ